MSTPPSALVNVAARLAVRAGDLVLVGRRRGIDEVGTKSSATDMVTEWDGRSERFITDELARLRPGDGVVGEEGSDRPSSTGVSWLVDPIDGTTNYLYGLAGYAVSIAAVDETGTIAGAVFLPATRELFVAARGRGAWLGGRRLECHPPDRLETALVGTGFSYEADRRRRQGSTVAELVPRVRDIRRLGAAAPDLCFVAAGRLDAYYEENLNPWDLAAGLLIAHEAGARSSDFSGGPARPEQVVVAAPGVHEALLELLQDRDLLHP